MTIVFRESSSESSSPRHASVNKRATRENTVFKNLETDKYLATFFLGFNPDASFFVLVTGTLSNPDRNRRAMRLRVGYHTGPPDDAGLLRVPAPTTRHKRDPGPKYGEEGFSNSPAAHLAHRGIVVVEGIYPPSLREKTPRYTYAQHREHRPFDERDLEGTFGKTPGGVVKKRKQVWLNKRSAPWSPAVWRGVREILLQLRLIHPVHHFHNGHTVLCTEEGSSPQCIHRDFKPGGTLFTLRTPRDGCYLYPISVLIATSPEGRKLGLEGGRTIHINQWDAFVFRGDLKHNGMGYNKYNEAQHFYVGYADGGRGGKYAKYAPRNAVIVDFIIGNRNVSRVVRH
jgi:hypothetical protein